MTAAHRTRAELFRMALGDELRTARERIGWSRQQVVDGMTITMGGQTLLGYENGSRNVTGERLWQICEALGLDVGKVVTAAAAQVAANPPVCDTCHGTGMKPPSPTSGEHSDQSSTHDHHQSRADGAVDHPAAGPAPSARITRGVA